ncbi:putative dsRNA-binding protein [Streptomyces sp. NPDC005774]|uniref:putative dsRNA-binding protein n=1 Tax=Streptomyces sp. NPDC005774 TaxID=3364728 RepID=UPI0036CC6FAD
MNRWVGIVSLRETAAPTPVHRIALAIEAARARTSYSLGGRKVSYERMRRALRRVGQTYAARSEWDRWSYCVDLAGDFFDGGVPPAGLPPWLTVKLQDLFDGDGMQGRGGRSRKAPQRTIPSRDRRGAPSEHGGRTTPPTKARLTTRQPPQPEPVRPYSRAVRQLAARDVTYPALCKPPLTLVGTYGEVVRDAVGKAVRGWDAGPEETAWLGLAAEHRSHLYESRHTDQVTPHVLGLLDRLGGTALDVILLDAYGRWAAPHKPGEQAAEHARRRSAAETALGRWAARHGLARMGAGEAQQPARSVAEGVARQVIGVLSLCGKHQVARRLVAAVWPDLDRPSTELVTDFVTLANTAFCTEGLVYDYEEEGPDHSKVFCATARTDSGRRAEGTGASKKAARAAAARALLDRYPQATGTVNARQKAEPAANRTTMSPLPYAQPGNRHRDAMSDLAAMFELGHRADGLLAQGLTHASWVKENPATAHAARQRDNQLLAHHGSHVIEHLAAHVRARLTLARSLTPDEDEARVHSISEEDTARLGGTLQLAEGLLTGRGESGQRRSLVSGAAQAAVAAAWRTHGPRMLLRRPAVLDDWLTGLEHRLDTVTLLAAMTAAYGIDHDYEYVVSGPEHLTSYTATVILRDTRGRVHRWTEPLVEASGKPAARKASAEAVLDILATPVNGVVDDLSAPERDLLAYLLRAQIDGLGPTTERQRARVMARGDLGTDLLATGDTKAFLTWADHVTALLGPAGDQAPEALRELYRKVVDDTRRGPRSLLRRMAAEAGTDAGGVVRRHAAEAVRRAAATAPRAASVRDVVQDWWRDQAPRTGVTVRDDMRQETFLPLSVHLGALNETLTWCGEAADAVGTPVDIELTIQDGTLHLWIGLHGVDVHATCDELAQLLSRTLPYTDCLVDDDHVLLRLHSRPETQTLSSVAAAGLDAYLSEHASRSKEPTCDIP